MLEIVGIIYFVYTLLKIYISVMEIGHVSREKHKNAIILSSSNYIKAAEYKVSSERFSIVSNLFDYAMFFFWIVFGLKWLSGFFVEYSVLLRGVILLDLFFIINYLLSLPFDIYKTFVLDKKFGFTNIDIKTFITDQIKSSLLFLLFGSLIIYVISYIILNITNWWIWGFALMFGIIILINAIYPTLIAPIFNKFSRLENEDLENAIVALLNKVGFKSSGVFTIDASKRDSRLNAYFGGLGNTKRVVLFDTLIEKLSKSELLAVLGHELGHFKHKDILKNIALMALVMFILFGVFGNLPISLFDEIGVAYEPFSILAIFILLGSVLTFFIMPIMGYFSRKNEYAADEFGSKCESKEALANALIKLSNENKSFPKSHPLSIFFYFTHPPLVERLKKLGVNV